MSEWQPIETAPRDGTPILVFGGEFTPSVDPPRPVESAVKCERSIEDGVLRYFVCDTDYYSAEVVGPTHWQPLPQPPKETA